jgi:hypothetical protein
VNESALNTETRLPRQVKERADRARAALAPTDDAPPAPVAEAKPDTPPAPAAEPQPPAPVADPRDSDPVYWKHRFNVTDGMLKADRKRHAEATRALDEQLQNALARIRELEDKAATGSDDINLEEFFTAEEIETLGEDQARIQARAIIKQAKRIAKETVDREVEPLRKKAKDEQAESARTANQKFLEGLTERAPNWQAVNADPRWLAYLEQKEPHTGLFRQTVLDYAQAEGDFVRVAGMIKEFEATLNPAPVRDEPPVVPQGHAAVPGAPPPPPQSGRGHPSKQEIRDYYKRRAIGKISEAEVKEFEARMSAARAAGALV